MSPRRVAAVDIGGSGAKAAWVEVSASGRHVVHDVVRLGSADSLPALAAAITHGLGTVEDLGISTAGYVDLAGNVGLSRAAPYLSGLRSADLARQLGCRRATVLNDGEAHLCAHLGGTTAYPLMCLSLGTSVGFALTDDRGRLRRPRADRNWDIGGWRIPTSAADPEVWWALGSAGLAGLQAQRGTHDGAVQYGYRLGGLLRNLCVIFAPRSVVLSGGIASALGTTFLPATQAEVDQTLPDHVDRPAVRLSPFGGSAALVGAAAEHARRT